MQFNFSRYTNALIHRIARTGAAMSFYALCMAAVWLYYRAAIYILIGSMYPEFQPMSFIDYGALSAYHDASAVFFSMALFGCISAFTLGRPVLFRWITAFMMLAQTVFMLATVEFFKIYQTAFQANFLGEENYSDLNSFFLSFSAETPFSFFIRAGIAFVLIVLMTWALERIGFRGPHALPLPRHRQGRVSWGVVTGALAGLVLVLVMITGQGAARAMSERLVKLMPGVPEKKFSSVLREITINPLWALFLADSVHPSNPGTDLLKNDINEDFSFRFDTRSLESSKMHPRITSIPRGKRYNIILYFFESTPFAYYDLEAGGKPIMPVWHRLQRNALFARRHYANYPLSANAMLSVLTGAYGSNEKDLVITKHPAVALESLPQTLKKHGYRTYCVHSGGLKYAGQDRFLAHRSFDRIDDYNDIRRPPYTNNVGWGLDDRSMIQPTLSFIREKPDEPFFVSVYPVSPHHPYPIPEERFNITGLADEPDPRKKVWLQYLNSLHYSDAVLGEFVDELERHGLMDNTVLFVFGDHGEAFYQHRKNYNHPFFIYEENVHVPFILYSKRFFPETCYYEGVSRHIDIMPTVLDLLGIPPVPTAEGISILASHPEQLALLHTSWRDDLMGVRDGRWKYIMRTADRFEELYDLSSDPRETNNLASPDHPIAARYRDLVLRSRNYKDEFYRVLLSPKK